QRRRPTRADGDLVVDRVDATSRAPCERVATVAIVPAHEIVHHVLGPAYRPGRPRRERQRAVDSKRPGGAAQIRLVDAGTVDVDGLWDPGRGGRRFLAEAVDDGFVIRKLGAVMLQTSDQPK